MDGSAKDLLESRGVNLFSTDRDMTASNLKMFAEMGAAAQKQRLNLYFCLGEYVCWAVISASEADVRRTVGECYGQAYSAHKAQSLVKEFVHETKED